MALTLFKKSPWLNHAVFTEFSKDKSNQEHYHGMVGTTARTMFWREIKDRYLETGPDAQQHPLGESLEPSGLEHFMQATAPSVPSAPDTFNFAPVGVTDSVSTDPIEGATVTMVAYSNSMTYLYDVSKETNADGLTGFDDYIDAVYVEIHVVKDGYVSFISDPILVDYDEPANNELFVALDPE